MTAMPPLPPLNLDTDTHAVKMPRNKALHRAGYRARTVLRPRARREDLAPGEVPVRGAVGPREADEVGEGGRGVEV